MANNVTINQLRKHFEEWKARTGQDHIYFSKQLNIKPSLAWLLFYGSSDKVPKAIVRKVINTLIPDSWRIVQTYNQKAIYNFCEMTHRYSLMTGLIGEPGTGKTTGLLNYKNRNSHHCFMVTWEATMNSYDFLETVLNVFGISYRGSAHSMLNKLTDEILSHQSTLLIIDEADKILIGRGSNIFPYIHALRNRTNKNLGILLSGVNEMYMRLKKAESKKMQSIQEFLSRVSHWEPLPSPIKSEIIEICHLNGIHNEDLVKQLTKLTDLREVYNKIRIHLAAPQPIE